MLLLFMLAVVFIGYVEIINQNSKNMTYRQKVLKAVYPAWMWLSRLTGKNNTKLENEKKAPPVSFYTLKGTLNNGDQFDFRALKGKKILIVNTASNCGYTDQYEDLQSVFSQHGSNLMVIGFPSNDFKEQEKGSDEEIAAFCKLNYGVSFPLMKKSAVKKGNDQNEVYQWLTDPAKNGWNSQAPEWNFSKYLVNEEGVLTHYFGPSVSPAAEKVKEAIGL